ncbi:uncharacterized protein LOC132742825 isoform X3 [Ruditapes philippinarum]|uniref:uncharacterized protein LOC132742825 isoform X3 n=1 Tax=Ruditapes philippinarum TaxID=129788 RepID=UPI00295B4486|nr:uncharacterized protein LOC132742825 isoform X3 [Ruditapes philippinarum]
MGANISKPGTVRRKYRIPKKVRKLFKRKAKYIVIEHDKVDSAVPFLPDGNKSKKGTDKNAQRSVSIETTLDGDLELCINGAHEYTDMPSDISELEDEDQITTPVSQVESLFDRRSIHTSDSALDIHYNTDTSVDDCHLCKAKNTEYMIHVFLPKLQRHLNVKEILPYLTYIDESDARTISTTEPHELAVEKLIDTIENNVDHVDGGKWLMFLGALEEIGNIYLYQLLTGQTEKDHHFTAQILKVMKPSLINNIHLNEVIDLLLEKEIINVEDQGQIESADKNHGPIQAVRVMLEKVDKRIPNWYTEFADVLNKAGMSEIAGVFKMIEHHEHIRADVDETPVENPPIGKRLKRKFMNGTRGKCNLHNRIGSACCNAITHEPKSTRIRAEANEDKEEDGGTTNMAFSMTSLRQPFEMELDELKKEMSDLQKIGSSVGIIERNQNELMKKIDSLINMVNKSSDELMLLKKQIAG